MKKALIALLLAAVLAFPGCDMVGGDITTLMSAPKLTGEQQAIEQALSAALGGPTKYTLKYPLEGEYRSSFILHNLDRDDEQEAIAFYCPVTDKAGTHVMVLKKAGGKWKKFYDISGDGNEVDQIDFGDFDGNGQDDIAIGWTLFTGTDLKLGVYSLDGNKYVKTYINNSFTYMKMLDMDGDGRTDILLLSLNSADKEAWASLISYKKGRLGEISRTPLDSTVSSYADINVTAADGQTAALIDGYKGAHSMVTELVTWKDGKLHSPLFDPKRGTVTATLREVSINCTDIDGDGLCEVPVPVELPGYEKVTQYDKKLWLVGWSTIGADGEIRPKFNCVMNTAEGYYYLYPDSWNKEVTVDNSNGDDSWIFKVLNPDTKTMSEKLFSICVYNEDDWNSNTATQGSLVKIGERNGTVYAASLGTKNSADTAYYQALSDIRENFRIIR